MTVLRGILHADNDWGKGSDSKRFLSRYSNKISDAVYPISSKRFHFLLHQPLNHNNFAASFFSKTLCFAPFVPELLHSDSISPIYRLLTCFKLFHIWKAGACFSFWGHRVKKDYNTVLVIACHFGSNAAAAANERRVFQVQKTPRATDVRPHNAFLRLHRQEHSCFKHFNTLLHNKQLSYITE